MEKILHEVLAKDKSLLSRRDELIAELEKNIPPNKSRDFASIKRALSFNVGEKFCVGDANREATKAEVAKILKEGGLQETRIDFVINTFVKALDWDKPKIPLPEKKSNDAKESESKKVAETFKEAKTEQKSSAPPPKPSPPPKQRPKLTYQPPPKPTTPPQQATDTQSANKKNLLIGLICVAMLALFFVAGRSSNPSTPLASNTQQVETTQNLSSSPPHEETAYLNARTDLSLNGMDLDISITEAEKILGRPNRIEKVDGYDRYIYSDNFYIAVINGKVNAFVTSDPKFKTKRGLHVGSTYSEVIDKYGADSMNTTAGNLTLREYPFISIDGKKGLLRFAVDGNGRVEYISIRIVEEPPALDEHWIKDANGVYLWNPQPQEGERITWSGGSVQDSAYKFADGSGVVKWYNKNGELVQTDEGIYKSGQRHGKFKHTFKSGKVEYITWENGKEVQNTSSGIDNNVRQAAATFERYHQLITDGNYSAAFNLFTEARKEEMNYNVQTFAKGYSSTITSEIIDLQLVSSSDSYVVMDYILDARDRAGGGRTLYQRFRGQVEMIKVDNEWKIGETHSKRVKEVMER